MTVPTEKQIEAAWFAYQNSSVDLCADHDDEQKRILTLALSAALAVEAGTDAENWAATWHKTVETMCVLLDINGSGSPEEILTELQAALTTSPVDVKPLEWVPEDNGDFIAQSVIGWYHIGLPHRTWNLTTPQGAVPSFDTIEAAKAAAQADYEARIRSALTTSPASSGVEGEAVAEPYGYAFQHEDTGLEQVVDVQQVEWGFEKNNPRWQKLGPVYMHPPAPPSDLLGRVLAYLEGADPNATSGGERNSQLRDAIRATLGASK